MQVYQLKADPKVKKYTDEEGTVLGWDNSTEDAPVAPNSDWVYLGTSEEVAQAARRVDQKAYAFWVKQGLSVEEATRRSTRVA